jgi:hypothetical protein
MAAYPLLHQAKNCQAPIQILDYIRHMKLTIEISEETAAAFWGCYHRPLTIAKIISDNIALQACRYRFLSQEDFIHDMREFKDTDAAKELTE